MSLKYASWRSSSHGWVNAYLLLRLESIESSCVGETGGFARRARQRFHRGWARTGVGEMVERWNERMGEGYRIHERHLLNAKIWGRGKGGLSRAESPTTSRLRSLDAGLAEGRHWLQTPIRASLYALSLRASGPTAFQLLNLSQGSNRAQVLQLGLVQICDDPYTSLAQSIVLQHND